CLQYLNTPFTF
nr:immunoglobulin light chain junction region [Macaca mulatta]